MVVEQLQYLILLSWNRVFNRIGGIPNAKGWKWQKCWEL